MDATGFFSTKSSLFSAPRRRSRQIGAALAALLLGGGGAAFAVASLAPATGSVMVRQVLDSVEPRPLIRPIEGLAAPDLNLYRTETVRLADTVDSLLRRLELDDAGASAFLRADPAMRRAVLGRAGRSVSIEATPERQLVRLSARWLEAGDEQRQFQRLVVERDASDRFSSRIETVPLAVTTRIGTAVIRSSLLAATDEANLPEPIAAQLVDMFDDIDFSADLHRGDRFSVVYEAFEADGEVVRSGRVLSAEYESRGGTRQAIWFQPGGTDELTGKPLPGGYYTPSGQSLHRQFLASPLEFSRVTSGFRMREHPISKNWRAHLGVDYGAPAGTPVRSVADGMVEFAGVQSGYGNVVQIRHRNSISTLYAHLSRINVKTDQLVSQGDNIGLVGSTGWATGAHLHFEFRIDGVHHDPLTITQQNDTAPLPPAAKPAFLQVAATMRAQLAAAGLLALQASAR